MRKTNLNTRTLTKIIGILFIVLAIMMLSNIFIEKTIQTISAKNKSLPIYCVETDEKKVAISFDAAWGNDINGQFILMNIQPNSRQYYQWVMYMDLNTQVTYIIAAILILIVFITSRTQKGTNNYPKGLSNLKKLSPREFEYYCADYLKQYEGFEKATVTQATIDGGIDILGYRDGIKYIIRTRNV